MKNIVILFPLKPKFQECKSGFKTLSEFFCFGQSHRIGYPSAALVEEGPNIHLLFKFETLRHMLAHRGLSLQTKGYLEQ